MNDIDSCDCMSRIFYQCESKVSMKLIGNADMD